MRRSGLVLAFVLMTLSSVRAFAGPAEDVMAAVDRWVTTFNANDVGALVKLYTPDAVLVGAAGSTLNEGSGAIHTYFGRLENSGDKVSIGIRKVFLLDDNVAYVTGFDEFTAVRNGETKTSPNGFTMILVRRGNEWLIAHQHSSRRG